MLDACSFVSSLTKQTFTAARPDVRHRASSVLCRDHRTRRCIHEWGPVSQLVALSADGAAVYSAVRTLHDHHDIMLCVNFNACVCINFLSYVAMLPGVLTCMHVVLCPLLRCIWEGGAPAGCCLLACKLQVLRPTVRDHARGGDANPEANVCSTCQILCRMKLVIEQYDGWARLYCGHESPVLPCR
jgi:hypothetical protein